MIFPVVYSATPVQVKDLLEDKKCSICKYPLEAAILSVALNKANVWDYENEWRLIHMLPTMKEKLRRLSIIVPLPTRVFFGYHFLKSFFYYNCKDSKERESAQNKIKDFNTLLQYISLNRIPISIMVPKIGGYELTKKRYSCC